MANFRLAEAIRDDMLTAISDALDAGDNEGYIEIYSGTQPATADDPTTEGNVLLATLTLEDPSADSVTGGILTLDTITEDAEADANGEATWARFLNSDDDVIFDCDVSETDGGGTIELNTVNIVAGGPVRITSATITIPAA